MLEVNTKRTNLKLDDGGLTRVELQVAGAHVFNRHVGTKLDALQVTVAAVETGGERVPQIQHQTGPTYSGRSRTHQT